MEQRALKRRRRRIALLLLLLLAVALGYGAWRASRPRAPERVAAPAASTADSALARRPDPPDDARAPAGVRVKVEVLNASGTRGLARRATMFLRDRGFDVVQVGNAPAAERRETTLVLDRSGHAEWARLVGLALGAPVETKPDTTRYVDVTVLLGRDWAPPAQPFYP